MPFLWRETTLQIAQRISRWKKVRTTESTKEDNITTSNIRSFDSRDRFLERRNFSKENKSEEVFPSTDPQRGSNRARVFNSTSIECLRYIFPLSMTTVVQVSRKFPSKRGSVLNTESRKSFEQTLSLSHSGSLLSPNGARQRMKVAGPSPSRTGINERTIPLVHAAGLPLNRANILCFPFRNFLSASFLAEEHTDPWKEMLRGEGDGCKGWIKISRYDNSRETFALAYILASSLEAKTLSLSLLLLSPIHI